jgi:ZIP family zinc transporter
MAYRRGVMLFIAMTLHNVPEGLAVGTSYAAQPTLGLLLALAIALHNVPEGIAVAGPFRACGMSRPRYLAWTVGSGLAEPIAALVGALFVSLFQVLVPFSLAFAGGAMLYVVSDELIPESHSHGFEHQATFGFISGFMLLLLLSQLFR